MSLLDMFKCRHEEPDPEEEDSIQGERELSSVNKGITLQNRITNWAVILCACALAAFLLFKYYAGMYQRMQETKAPQKDLTRTVTTSTLPPLALPDPEPVKTAATVTTPEKKLPPLEETTPTNSMPAGSASNGQPPVKTLAQLVHERRLKREVRFNLDGSAGAAAEPAVEQVAAQGQSDEATQALRDGVAPSAEPATAAAPRATARAGARAAAPASFAASRAYMLPDPTLMMTRGKAIPCTIVPAIDTTLPGTVTCVTPEDATGADNKVSLMDRGTLCTGKQGGGITRGQRRIGIIWERCETPQHVLVPLDANTTDALGRPGIPGQVDNHFWDRFGAAIALSLINDVGPYLIASRQAGSNNTTIAFPNITGPQEVMSEVLKSTADIPPTITGPQGARVLIYLNGDIDFRDVYQLERTK